MILLIPSSCIIIVKLILKLNYESENSIPYKCIYLCPLYYFIKTIIKLFLSLKHVMDYVVNCYFDRFKMFVLQR